MSETYYEHECSEKNAVLKPAAAILAPFIATAFFVVANSDAKSCPGYPYGPASTTLNGTLISERHYRPPYHDENPNHDVLIRILILKLDAPISTIPDAHERAAYRCVSKLQLMGDIPDGMWRSVGRKTTIRGMLLPQEIIRHYTRVLLMVQDVQFLEPAPSANRKSE